MTVAKVRSVTSNDRGSKGYLESRFDILRLPKVVLGITIEMTSCEIFMSMKITEHWLKVLWKQQVLSLKQLT